MIWTCDLETKVWNRPLMWHWNISVFLVNKRSVPFMIHQPSTVLKKLTFQYFSQMNALECQSNLFAGKAKVYLGSSFDKIWKASSHQCCIHVQSFKVLCFLVLEKKSFTIYGHGGHLGQEIPTIWINFCSARIVIYGCSTPLWQLLFPPNIFKIFPSIWET